MTVVPLLAALLAAACTDGGVAPPVAAAPASLVTRPATVELDGGQDWVFSAWLVGAGGDSVPAGVTWSATAGSIDASGHFVAPMTPGPVLVVARAGSGNGPGSGAADTSHVSVRGPDPGVPASIRVDAEGELALLAGQSADLTHRVANAYGALLDAVPVEWRSSAPEVAAVDGAGRVTAAAPGVARILVAVTGTALADSVAVRVQPRPVAAVRVQPGDLSVPLGATPTFAATPFGPDGVPLSGRDVVWASTDPDVATVDGAGAVRTFAPGTSSIEATVEGVVGSARLTVVDTVPPPPPPPAVARVEVTPATATLALGGSMQLSAVPRAADDSPLAGHSVAWASADTGVLGVDGAGRVTGRAPGTTTVTATVEGVAGSASVTVTDTATVVGSVSVSPASSTLDPGQVVALTATVRDVGGAVVPGMPVQWSSSAPGVAAVDATGTVTAVAAGAATVRAESGGVTGSATVTVHTPPPPPPPPGGTLTDECQTPGPGWIWCDDFEQDRLASYFEFSDGGGSFQRTAGIGAEGSTGMRARFAAGQVSAGNLHLAVGRTPQAYIRPADAGTADYRELFWRVYLRHQPGWVGGGGYKLTRAFVFATPTSWAQAMIANVWSGGPGHEQLFIDPARGTDEAGNLITTEYNDFANLVWLGSAGSSTPLFDAAHVGSWYCVEVRVRLNDAGQTNGVFELWIDDQLEAQRTGLNWLGGFSAYGLNAVFLENYWNTGSPVAQERYMDNFVVSTQRIGC